MHYLNDPDLSISWPIKDPIISKDSEGSLFVTCNDENSGYRIKRTIR